MEYQIHPACELFPPLDDVQYAELRDDIARNGQYDPIVVDGAFVIDGKNRLRACLELNIEPKVQEWNYGDISRVEWAVSRNLRRRHLTVSQRSMVGQQMLPLLEAEADIRRKGRRTSKNASGVKEIDENTNEIDGSSTVLNNTALGRSKEIAAKAVGVSPDVIARAKRIAMAVPGRVPEIIAGKATLGEVERELKEEKRRATSVTGIADKCGNLITDPKLVEVFENPILDSIGGAIAKMIRELDALRAEPIGSFLNESITSHLDAARNGIRAARPYTICPSCKRGCKACKSQRWVPKLIFDGITAEDGKK